MSIPQPKIHVRLEDGGARLLVTCPIWANDWVKAFPSRRWLKGARAWACPIIRRNVEYARELQRMAGVEFTEDAVAALDRHEKEVANTRGKGAFPAWFPFKTKPQKHQVLALDKGYPLTAYALFMDMGTGKSFTAIALNSAWRMEGQITAWVIVCKLSLRRNWLGELAKHCAIPYDAYLPDTDKERQYNAWLSAPHDFKILIVGVESLSAGKMASLVEKFITVNSKVSMTVDESSYIAGYKALRSKECVRLGAQCVRRQALTGTPIPDSPLNLFMQFEFLDSNIIGIGDYYAFRNRYAVMGGYKPDPKMKTGIQVLGYQNLEELTQTVAPYTFQVQKSEVYDLPPKRYKQHVVQMTKKQRAMYDQIRREEEYTHRGKASTIQTCLELELRLHQVCGGWVGVEQGVDKKGKRVYKAERVIPAKENPKLLELADIIEHTGRKQGIVWCVYDGEIDDCVALLRGFGKRVGQLHGRIPEADRQPTVDAFEKGEIDWVVGNAGTGGMGYTMNAASVVIYYNNTNKLIDRLQSEDRPHRYGQTKSVLFIDLVVEKSADVVRLRAIAAKQDLATFVRERLDAAIRGGRDAQREAVRVVAGDEDDATPLPALGTTTVDSVS